VKDVANTYQYKLKWRLCNNEEKRSVESYDLHIESEVQNMLEDIYKMLGFDDTVFDTETKTDKAHTKLMELLDMCEQLGIVGIVDEDMLDRIESEDF
jgi:hypothetical protein